MKFTKEYRHYKNAVLFSLLLATVVVIFIFINGKENSFLVINKHNHPSFDYVFAYLTLLGDGIIWIPFFIYALFFKREFLVAMIASLIICTVLTHFLKRVVFPNDMRPIVTISEERIKIIQGIKIIRAKSFPSGHTSTAFTLALLMAFIIKRNFWVYFFPLVAFFVGYSRVYLAQHFVTDVFAGMLVGIVSSYLSLLVYEKFKRRKKPESTIMENKNDFGSSP